MTSGDVQEKLGIPRKWLDNYAKEHSNGRGKAFDWEAHFAEIKELYNSQPHRTYVKSGKYSEETKQAKLVEEARKREEKEKQALKPVQPKLTPEEEKQIKERIDKLDLHDLDNLSDEEFIRRFNM